MEITLKSGKPKRQFLVDVPVGNLFAYNGCVYIRGVDLYVFPTEVLATRLDTGECTKFSAITYVNIVKQPKIIVELEY